MGTYFNTVFKYDESMHSGVYSRLISLDPQNAPLEINVLWLLQEVESFASTYISAYRALEWYSQVDPQYISDTAKEILSRINKPTKYLEMLGTYKEVED